MDGWDGMGMRDVSEFLKKGWMNHEWESKYNIGKANGIWIAIELGASSRCKVQALNYGIDAGR